MISKPKPHSISIEPSIPLVHDHIKSHLRRHANPSNLHEPEKGTSTSGIPSISTLLIRVRVTSRIHAPAQQPNRAHGRAGHGVLEPRHRHARQHDGVVLEEVAVGSLGAVEQVHGLLLVRGGGGHGLLRGIGVGVGNAGVSSEGGYACAVPEGHDVGGCAGKDDVAVDEGVSGWIGLEEVVTNPYSLGIVSVDMFGYGVWCMVDGFNKVCFAGVG
jgi:hypothetical protein